MHSSANHSGALRFHDAVGKQFADDSAEEVGWLQPVVSAETPLVLQLGDERVKISGFVATRARQASAKCTVETREEGGANADRAPPRAHPEPPCYDPH